jgi:hypothetical protein
MQTQEEFGIKPRSALAARPRTLSVSRNLYAAARARIDVAPRSPRRRANRCANLVERGSSESGHAMRDAIVPMLRVPPEIAVEPVSHMQELLGDDDFERPRPRLIDARQIDQDEMIAGRGRESISAANRAPEAATQPAFEDATLGSDAEAVRWQCEERNVSFQKLARFLVVDQPIHDHIRGDG